MYYIKVARTVAEKINAPVKERNLTADKNILLWMADLNMIPGETIFDRAAYVGGAVLPAPQAKAEIDGTCGQPAEVTIPEIYQDKENTTDQPTILPELPAEETNPENKEE